MTDNVELRKFAQVKSSYAAIFLRNIIGKRNIEFGENDPAPTVN
jgi:hypothetical protein